MPVALAPIGMGGVFHPGAEIHAARAAAAFGVPYCLSTLSSYPMEEVAAAVSAPSYFSSMCSRIARSIPRFCKGPSV